MARGATLTGGRSARLATGAAAVVLTLVALEGATRVMDLGPPATAMNGYVSDPVLPFRCRPNVSGVDEIADGVRIPYHHNSLGFRDDEHAFAKPAGTLRVVGLGDSFTYGTGAPMEASYLEQLERRLNRRPAPHPPVEAINLGLPRYFPSAEALLLQHYGLRFDPDVVIVGVTPNDVIDTFLGLDAVTVHESGYLVPRATQQLGPFATTLFLHSQLARMVVARTLAPRGTGGEVPRPDDVFVAGGFHEWDWQALESDLHSILGLARRHGARVAVVGIPQSGLDGPGVQYFDSRLAVWSRSENTLYISVLDALRTGATVEPMYWRQDGHCRPAGYAVIAETIADALIGAGMVP